MARAALFVVDIINSSPDLIGGPYLSAALIRGAAFLSTSDCAYTRILNPERTTLSAKTPTELRFTHRTIRPPDMTSQPSGPYTTSRTIIAPYSSAK